jgi:peptidoglycan hydrolase-like protein with peptidoglycan-binding domain
MFDMMRALFASLVLCVSLAIGTTAGLAQQSWVQVESHPSLRTAQERARSYGVAFNDVSGFLLPGGWYTLALGPYPDPATARARLRELRAQGVIPRDSYITDGTGYRDQFWPIGAAIGTATPATPEVTPEVTPAPAPDTAVAPEVNLPEPADLDETPREARASERLLEREEREELQVALQWFGFYTAAIDGSFGRGTRGSMARWQTANAYDPTGILTTKQRADLLAQYQAALAALGLGTVDEDKAGIKITMPTGLVEFEGYDYPFVRYAEKDGSGVQVLLISQAGDGATLGGLYEIMQTLEIVPLEGQRVKRADSFTLRGKSDTLESYTYAKLDRGYVKGFTLVYPPARAADMARVIEIMQDSFEMTEGSLVATDSDEATQSVDLLSGLELRKPKQSRSGFYVDGRGAVVTVADVIGSCERITLDGAYDAEVVATANGLALLRPKDALVPLGFARFAPNLGRLRSPVAVSGYSYEGALTAPTLTFGTLEDLRDLRGDARFKRLDLAALSGDVGGPVLDEAGAVSGMLTPLDAGGRTLPEGTAFALKSGEITAFLTENGVAPVTARGGAELGAEALLAQGTEITVLVSCW